MAVALVVKYWTSFFNLWYSMLETHLVFVKFWVITCATGCMLSKTLQRILCSRHKRFNDSPECIFCSLNTFCGAQISKWESRHLKGEGAMNGSSKGTFTCLYTLLPLPDMNEESHTATNLNLL